MSDMFKRTKNDPRMTKQRGQGLRTFFAGRKRRLHRVNDPWRVRLFKKQPPWGKMISPLLMVLIPVFILMAASNILLRLPDLYEYHLLSSEVLSERMVSAEEADVASLISDYMLGQTDKFQMKEDLEYLPDELFSSEDGEMMSDFRQGANRQAVAGIMAFIFTAAAIFILLRMKERDRILRSFYFSLPFFLAGLLMTRVTLLVPGIRVWLYGIAQSPDDGTGSLLPAILSDDYFRLLAMAGGILSLVLLGIVYYVVLMLSGRRGTFRR